MSAGWIVQIFILLTCKNWKNKRCKILSLDHIAEINIVKFFDALRLSLITSPSPKKLKWTVHWSLIRNTRWRYFYYCFQQIPSTMHLMLKFFEVQSKSARITLSLLSTIDLTFCCSTIRADLVTTSQFSTLNAKFYREPQKL